jgi:hypothetical protein
MGAWAAHAFGNDNALDWFGEEFVREPVGAVKSVIGLVLNATASDYLESPEGCAGLAAAEIVAIAHGRARTGEEQELVNQVRPHAEAIMSVPQIKQDALGAVDRIEGSNSELNELWNEDNPDSEWTEQNADLRSRLS